MDIYKKNTYIHIGHARYQSKTQACGEVNLPFHLVSHLVVAYILTSRAMSKTQHGYAVAKVGGAYSLPSKSWHVFFGQFDILYIQYWPNPIIS